MKEKLGELFYIDRAAENLTKPTVGMIIVLVALDLLSTGQDHSFIKKREVS